MKDIEGIMTIGDKLWFNEGGYQCRLRICGFSKEQIKKLEEATFIDITLLNIKGNKGEAHISILTTDDIENVEE